MLDLRICNEQLNAIAKYRKHQCNQMTANQSQLRSCANSTDRLTDRLTQNRQTDPSHDSGSRTKMTECDASLCTRKHTQQLTCRETNILLKMIVMQDCADTNTHNSCSRVNRHKHTAGNGTVQTRVCIISLTNQTLNLQPNTNPTTKNSKRQQAFNYIKLSQSHTQLALTTDKYTLSDMSTV